MIGRLNAAEVWPSPKATSSSAFISARFARFADEGVRKRP
jgi:hypothetical protein